MASNVVSKSAAAVGRPLTICMVGYAGSSHIASRVKCFAERGHRVYLITETASHSGIEGVVELVPKIRHPVWLLGIVRSFKQSPWLARRADDVARLLEFLRLLNACKPDIIHVHFAYTYYGWIAGLVACRPLVVSIMGGDILFDEQGEPTLGGKWLTRQLLASAQLITSKSDFLIEVLNKLGGFGTKAIKIVWGVDLSRFRRTDTTTLRARLGLSPSARIILSPKILQPFYNVHLLVDALPAVIRAVPDARLLITEYGADPAYKRQIVERVEALGLKDFVIFCGHVPHDDMPSYYSLADVAVAVPLSDGLPQTLLESMACGTPNVLSRLERYEELVTHGVSAYFVDSEPRGIGDGIIDLLNSAALRRKIAENALKIVWEEGNFQQEVTRVEERYYELARSTSPRYCSSAKLLWNLFRFGLARSRF